MSIKIKFKSMAMRLLVALKLRRVAPVVTSSDVMEDLHKSQRAAAKQLQVVSDANKRIAASYDLASERRARESRAAASAAITHRNQASSAANLQNDLLVMNAMLSEAKADSGYYEGAYANKVDCVDDSPSRSSSYSSSSSYDSCSSSSSSDSGSSSSSSYD